MFVLLNRLAGMRRQIGLKPAPAPRSMAVRHVDAGSCNGCEHELQATFNPYYDVQRFGLDVVASPRHADLLLITGPVTTRMVEPLRRAYAAMPEPRLVAALGDCAIGCGYFEGSDEVIGAVEQIIPVDLIVPGCPPTPERIAAALQGALDLVRPLPSSYPRANAGSRK